MPLGRSLSVFTRRAPITDAEWIELIEERRRLVAPHLDSFTLPMLGDFHCLLEWHKGEMVRTLPLSHGRKPGHVFHCLAIQGIFGYDPNSREPQHISPPDGTGKLRVWGLTRENRWVVVEVQVAVYPYAPGHAESLEFACDAHTVFTQEMLALAKIDGFTVWRRLGEVIASLVDARRKRYENVRHLAEAIRCEEELLRSLRVNCEFRIKPQG